MPARISDAKAEEIKQTAKRIYRALGCAGFARVDLFLTPSGHLVFNEVNTIPGFKMCIRDIIMALLYIVGSLIVIGVNYQHIGQAFVAIFVGAFRPEAVLGGAAGISVKMAVRYGVSRGLFSNEAGMGSTPHALSLIHI